MVRTKRSGVVEDDPMDAQPVDLRQEYHAPFPIYNPVEGTRFARFRLQAINKPRLLDWDLLQRVGVKEQLLEYLKTLGMVRYAQMDHDGYTSICQEFLCTLDFAGDLSSFTCRFAGQQCKVTMGVMTKVFGFPARGVGVRCVPSEFNPAMAWHELTGFHNWRTGGISNGFLRDPVVGILHKFLSYNISGNEEGNKVNQVELYLLDCAVNRRKVCATSFLFGSLYSLIHRSRFKPAFPHIAFALLKHFQIRPPQGLTFEDKLILAEINLAELKAARFVNAHDGLVAQRLRPCVINYLNAMATAQPVDSETAEEDTEGGDTEGGDTEGAGTEILGSDPEHTQQADTEQPWTDSESIHAPGTSSSGGFSQLRADFRHFRDDWGVQWGLFQRSNDSRWDAQTQHFAAIDTRLEAQTQHFAAIDTRLEAQNALLVEQNRLLTAHNEQLTLHQQQLVEQNRLWGTTNEQLVLYQQQLAEQSRSLNALRQQWSNWALFDDNPNAPPPDQQ